VLTFSGRTGHVKCSDPRVKARLQDGDGSTYLWVANPARQDVPIRLILSDAWGLFSSAQSMWGSDVTVDGQTVVLTAASREVCVIALT